MESYFSRILSYLIHFSFEPCSLVTELHVNHFKAYQETQRDPKPETRGNAVFSVFKDAWFSRNDADIKEQRNVKSRQARLKHWLTQCNKDNVAEARTHCGG